jgi:hypothetical protein
MAGHLDQTNRRGNHRQRQLLRKRQIIQHLPWRASGFASVVGTHIHKSKATGVGLIRRSALRVGSQVLRAANVALPIGCHVDNKCFPDVAKRSGEVPEQVRKRRRHPGWHLWWVIFIVCEENGPRLLELSLSRLSRACVLASMLVVLC